MVARGLWAHLLALRQAYAVGTIRHLMPATHTDDASRPVTFNVVFTRGYAWPLLPFALSLLQSPSVRVRLVGNGCAEDELELMGSLAAREGRLEHHSLPYALPVEHGVALNDLFEAFPEPHFAFIDSDVIASGDFMSSLGPLRPGQAGIFTAPPVWMTPAQLEARSSVHTLNAIIRNLPDGTYVGNTYCALYDRAALEPAWLSAPLGFCSHRAGQIPRDLNRWLKERGWRIRWLDSARVVNLQLLRAGHELEERAVPELHHAGGFSIRAFHGARGGLRRAAGIVRSGAGGRRFGRLADGAATRVYGRRARARARRSKHGRRHLVLRYLDEVLEAARAGETLPSPPRTGSDEVDRQVADLVSAVETHYPAGLSALREASPTPAIDPARR